MAISKVKTSVNFNPDNISLEKTATEGHQMETTQVEKPIETLLLEAVKRSSSYNSSTGLINDNISNQRALENLLPEKASSNSVNTFPDLPPIPLHNVQPLIDDETSSLSSLHPPPGLTRETPSPSMSSPISSEIISISPFLLPSDTDITDSTGLFVSKQQDELQNGEKVRKKKKKKKNSGSVCFDEDNQEEKSKGKKGKKKKKKKKKKLAYAKRLSSTSRENYRPDKGRHNLRKTYSVSSLSSTDSEYTPTIGAGTGIGAGASTGAGALTTESSDSSSVYSSRSYSSSVSLTGPPSSLSMPQTPVSVLTHLSISDMSVVLPSQCDDSSLDRIARQLVHKKKKKKMQQKKSDEEETLPSLPPTPPDVEKAEVELDVQAISAVPFSPPKKKHAPVNSMPIAELSASALLTGSFDPSTSQHSSHTSNSAANLNSDSYFPYAPSTASSIPRLDTTIPPPATSNSVPTLSIPKALRAQPAVQPPNSMYPYAPYPQYPPYSPAAQAPQSYYPPPIHNGYNYPPYSAPANQASSSTVPLFMTSAQVKAAEGFQRNPRFPGSSAASASVPTVESQTSVIKKPLFELPTRNAPFSRTSAATNHSSSIPTTKTAQSYGSRTAPRQPPYSRRQPHQIPQNKQNTKEKIQNFQSEFNDSSIFPTAQRSRGAFRGGTRSGRGTHRDNQHSSSAVRSIFSQKSFNTKEGSKKQDHAPPPPPPPPPQIPNPADYSQNALSATSASSSSEKSESFEEDPLFHVMYRPHQKKKGSSQSVSPLSLGSGINTLEIQQELQKSAASEIKTTNDNLQPNEEKPFISKKSLSPIGVFQPEQITFQTLKLSPQENESQKHKHNQPSAQPYQHSSQQSQPHHHVRLNLEENTKDKKKHSSHSKSEQVFDRNAKAEQFNGQNNTIFVTAHHHSQQAPYHNPQHHSTTDSYPAGGAMFMQPEFPYPQPPLMGDMPQAPLQGMPLPMELPTDYTKSAEEEGADSMQMGKGDDFSPEQMEMMMSGMNGMTGMPFMPMGIPPFEPDPMEYFAPFPFPGSPMPFLRKNNRCAFCSSTEHSSSKCPMWKNKTGKKGETKEDAQKQKEGEGGKEKGKEEEICANEKESESKEQEKTDRGTEKKEEETGNTIKEKTNDADERNKDNQKTTDLSKKPNDESQQGVKNDEREGKKKKENEHATEKTGSGKEKNDSSKASALQNSNKEQNKQKSENSAEDKTTLTKGKVETSPNKQNQQHSYHHHHKGGYNSNSSPSHGAMLPMGMPFVPVQCTLCGQLGHTAQFCPSLPMGDGFAMADPQQWLMMMEMWQNQGSFIPHV
ncbi:uncharacterized protein MONOS_17308 [Monocercomonoides exilis]|uniref:uncharacterized protein n=1 Tax=Monocercomonoides exilis TaxID=2049356 RepID=UPI00355A8327|nr:hypothetical protein MONOS_17308 [Monocercomonoides exilis]